ncbi:MAG: monofunctional biosynthetic peptidoglycan transglycosylase [Hyphomonadaceae bacterium]|nr:monofunctional biosynthetic peptidoglycan transglycosylase [Hyphomonadaceae bacterium]
MAQLSWPEIEFRPLKWAWRALQVFAAYLLALHLYALALIFLDPPATALMAQRGLEGEEILYHPAKLSDISPHLVRAVIAAEDTKFCQHNGVDMAAVQEAIDEWRAGEGLRGASTITQQTAKNVFFWNGGGLPRKVGDAWMALVIDTSWGKRRVMETYLNIAEWGDGLFGAEAAARNRFGKRAADLSPYEAAYLAAVLPSPNRWRVDPPGPYVRSRAATIRARMDVVRRDGLDACVLE